MLRTLLLLAGGYLLGLACGILIEWCRHARRSLRQQAEKVDRLHAMKVPHG